MGFSRCDSVFSLALPFSDSLDEMGSHTSVELDCRMDLKLSWVVSRLIIRPMNPGVGYTVKPNCENPRLGLGIP